MTSINHTFYLVSKDFLIEKKGKIVMSDLSSNILGQTLIHDDIVQFIIWTLNFIKFKNYKGEKEQYGIYYWGTSCIYDNELDKFAQIIKLWIEIFKFAPDNVKLSNEEYGKKHIILSELNSLYKVINEAIEKDFVLIHFGI